ncbi:site-specific recombinase [Riemerella anatipestifer]|uniref:Site-specific recombinase n=1 Tax=Riemerella anatipestifer TaxID=34085 RepID=A0AAP6LM96_RIEAN|nr:site-specific recombinase [Riemerella anatipestifer]MCD5967736.1 site-specific recombinase [Riemerella anatipestifer]MCO4304108.1 site-specific recombinase [Riemerella anatipestifer]MCO7316999.1 site-specific recombinase [Riemerella anatipestifer]MCO7319376.1 site-specific recombinase [Riemerella anatipestifer]MCO7324645.1 site-specific recombinase [Riemerella anatipestifer]
MQCNPINRSYCLWNWSTILNAYLNNTKAAQSISVFYSKNWANVISNFWFRVFLGASAPIGNFLGLDLDIRHINLCRW